MSVHDVVAVALLTLGVAAFAMTSLGLLLAQDIFDQIHFLAPGSLVGSLAIPAAVVLHEGLSQAGVKAVLIALLLAFSNPVLSHATGRAARIRRHHQLPPAPHEDIPFAGTQNE